jgi:hypothetical protein
LRWRYQYIWRRKQDACESTRHIYVITQLLVDHFNPLKLNYLFSILEGTAQQNLGHEPDLVKNKNNQVQQSSLKKPRVGATMSPSSPLNDGPPSSPDSAEWKRSVRKFWIQPLDERKEEVLLTDGELTLARGVRRKHFLDSFDHEDDDFARGMEWRAVNAAHSEFGDIVIIKLPNEPHELAAGALMRAVVEYVTLNTPSPSIRSAIVSTGSTRFTGGARSSESDGGFRPENSPRSEVSGNGEYVSINAFSNLTPLDSLIQSFNIVVLNVCFFWFVCTLQPFQRWYLR